MGCSAAILGNCALGISHYILWEVFCLKSMGLIVRAAAFQKRQECQNSWMHNALNPQAELLVDWAESSETQQF